MSRAAAAPRPSLIRAAIAVSPRSLSLGEGLRAAASCAVVVAIGSLLQAPILAWAAIAAFWTCLADPGGPNRDRVRALAGFSLLSGAFAVAGAAASAQGWPWATAIVFLCALIGSAVRVYGAAARQIGTLAVVACVVAVDHHTPTPAALGEFAAAYLGGCAWAMLLALSIWRIHPFRPAREGVATVYRSLAAMTAGLARLDAGAAPRDWVLHAQRYRHAVRSAIETGRATLDRTLRGRGLAAPLERLLLALDRAERVFARLIALSELRQHASGSGPQERLALRRLAMVLYRQAHAFAAGREDGAPWRRSLDRLDGLIGTLDDGPVAAGLRAIVDQLRSAGETPEVRARPAARQPWLAPLRAQLSWRSEVLRHALRCAVATAGAVMLSHILGLPYAYWMAMAVVLVLQPSVATTWPRALERAVGSVLGGALAALLGLVLHTPLALTAAVFPLAIATMAVRSVNYGLFVFFLTPLFVLVIELSQPGTSEPALAWMRALYNVLGSAIGVLGGLLLWPSREDRQLRPALAAAIEANGRYAALAFAPDRDEAAIEAARRAAGLASGNAEAAHGRTLLEAWWQRDALDAALSIVILARQLAGAATAAWLHRPEAGDAAFGQWIAAETAALAEALRHGTALPAAAAPPPGGAAEDSERSRLLQEILLLRAATEHLVPG
ncbi:FUSC family protein [Inquilinus sp. Marseille-Q2685]|uniref:FUSC family protein n=1 Tax=Inquilinus sp. Marseille-Q2685 TaxID=2866581 RepID=UPI001CE46571|nr:FUSC family protein [Inquilinus sp. Marseille-Q2685]